MPILFRDANVVHVGTWATIPAANTVPVDSEAHVTDILSGEYTGRTLMYSDGTNWRFYQETPVFIRSTSVNGAASATEQIANDFRWRAPVGLLVVGRIITLSLGVGKFGASDVNDVALGVTNTLTLGIRIGINGTTADATDNASQPFGFFNLGSALAAGNRSNGFIGRAVISAATTLQKFGSGYGGGSYGSATSGRPDGTITIPNVSSNANYFTPTLTPNGTTDLPVWADMLVTLMN